MASPPRRTLMGGHCVAIAGRALVWACATAAGVAVAFCRLAFEAVDPPPPPNMLPIEQPASSVARPAEATTRIKLFLVMSVLPARLRIGSFKRHEDCWGAAGVHPRAIFDKDIGNDTVTQDQCSASVACAHPVGGEVPGQTKGLGQLGVAISKKVDAVKSLGGFCPRLHDVLVVDRCADDLVDAGSLQLACIGEEARQMVDV